LLDEAGPVAELEQLLRSAIDEFCSQLPVSAEHPFAARKPDDYWLTLWAVVMHTQSHQVPHIHPSAWLSGVYYVEVPEVVLAGDSNGGWIEFGSRPSHFMPVRNHWWKLFSPKRACCCCSLPTFTIGPSPMKLISGASA